MERAGDVSGARRRRDSLQRELSFRGPWRGRPGPCWIAAGNRSRARWRRLGFARPRLGAAPRSSALSNSGATTPALVRLILSLSMAHRRFGASRPTDAAAVIKNYIPRHRPALAAKALLS